ncbi:dynactin-like protein Arp1 p62 subunit RO2 [Phyllosticta citriasiana]|uniref:Dynactin subunit 4 n=1 Tax=Phyllosticta citriasiana TaxID=595635 RepID=A0ABR1L0K2_9PEZI
MAQTFPYVFFSCPCVDTTCPSSRVLKESKRLSQHSQPEEEEGRTFDPRSSRANYALYPLENLLYCEDCHQIRCPRCVNEEVITWFCPSCLFEVPSSNIKSDGNRCMRSCFNCPVCTSPMIVNSLDSENERHARIGADGESAASQGPFYLACPYCQWTSLEVGLEFEKPQSISGQLARLQNGGKKVPTLREHERARDRRREIEDSGQKFDPDEELDAPPDVTEMDHDLQFSNLTSFYKNQLQSDSSGPYGTDYGFGYGNPNTLSRIMSLYSSTNLKKAKKDKPAAMREAMGLDEGLAEFDPAGEETIINRLKENDWDSLTASDQRAAQLSDDVRFTADLRPIPTLLRTKRAKRCRTCRHILARPETKISSSKYKIKLLALNNIPHISLRALPNPQQFNTSTSSSMTLPPAQPARPGSPVNYDALQPFLPHPFLLTIRNPLFDSIHVTLATPAVTPGRIASKITILCPEFDVGANTDVWDEALNASNSSASGAGTGSASAPGTLRGGRSGASLDPYGGGSHALEAGKIWDRGRNWTTVVVEIVPDRAEPAELEGGLDEDEDVLEVPLFVRIEYETEVAVEEAREAREREREREKAREKLGGGNDVVGEEKDKGEGRGTPGLPPGKVRREEAFWCVLGAGRIGALPKLG